MPVLRQGVFGSGPWEIDLGRRELRASGRPVSLGGRAFEILETLVLSSGSLVTKEELISRVWPGIVVEDNTLQVHVSAVRKAFGSDRGLLKTTSGRGYRLLGDWMPRWDDTSDHEDPAPAPVFGEPYRTNLPLDASDLIGRTDAVQQLKDLMAAYRVVTLTGAGGIGKTKLALNLAHDLFLSVESDVWFVDLAPLSDAGLVPSAVAGALRLELGANEISTTSVARAIGGRKSLLLMDNCEHIIDAAARMVETTVRTCPHTSILATSRELLRIEGEYAFRVPPLDLPPPVVEEPTNTMQYSAVELFIARMRALQSEFSPREDHLRLITAICRRLDGIPLAIELAAARAATLGLNQVLSPLRDRLELLNGGRRTALPRQQTLRATLDWSYELLSETERRLLQFLSVFAAGFTLEAAVAVTSSTECPPSFVVEGIANLVAKSLLALDGSKTPTTWRLLEITRAYARARLLESGHLEQAAQRHAAFFRDLFAPGALLLESSATNGAAARHLQEIDNVRAALDWAFSPGGDAKIGIELTAGYTPVWLHLSLLAECRGRAEQALRHLDAETNMDVRPKTQLQIILGGALLHTMRVSEQTGAVLAQALEAADKLNDIELQLRAVWSVWTYQFNNGGYRCAEALAERFLRVAAASDNQADMLVGHRLMGNVLHFAGDQTKARDFLQRVVDVYEVPPNRRHSVWFQYDQRLIARTMLARVLLLQGFPLQARLNAQSSVAQGQLIDHKASICYALGNSVGPIALLTGDLATVAQSLGLMNEYVTKHGVIFWSNWTSCLEGALLIKRGELAKGTALLRTSIAAFGRSDYVVVRSPEFLVVLSEALSGLGEFDAALSTIDDALEQSERSNARWCTAEFLRLKGELLLQSAKERSLDAASACFSAALETARQQGALLWELRSAVSLARLKARQGRQNDAKQLLAPIYARFTEGFETPDLQSARILLDTLSIAGA